MNQVLDKFKSELQKLKLKPQAKVLIAVSGGIDSMVLWALFRKSGFHHAVAHMNFSLRAQESDADEALVKREAAKYETPCYLKKVETTKHAKKKKISIQMAARELRYQWFEELMLAQGFDYLATAHHLDDSIETFFINLNRATGIKGLTGIHSNDKLIRPLLSFSKETIGDFAKAENIGYREDLSNASVKYERNWLRHTILKPLKERHPDFLKNMQTSMKHLEMIEDFTKLQIKKESELAAKELSKGFLSFAAIEQLSHPELILYFLLEPIGFNFATVSQILQAIKKRHVGSIFLADNIRILLDRKKLFIQKNIKKNNYSSPILIENGKKFIIEPLHLNFVEFEAAQFQFSSSKNMEGFDAEKLKFPLELRKWRAGDWMIPLGMKGRKKISDVLIDEKIPLHDKENCYILLSEGQVVWLLGIKMDNRFKVETKTKKIIQIQWIKKS